MRLVCPNCGAQYEVPDEVIPASGRDVQCSNCGDTWFQHHPDQDPELAAEFGEELAPEPEEPQETPEQSPPEPEPEPQPALEEEPEAPTPAMERTTPPVTPPRRKELDPSVADVLREEAAREAEARQQEAVPLEQQTDMALQDPDDEAARRQRQAQERMARIRGTEPEEPSPGVAAVGVTGSRRDVLPDIDEINSTLRKDSERRQTPTEIAESQAAENKKGGFASGFSIILIIAVILLLLYVFAPQISRMVPALAGIMETYVLTVNEMRIWFDQQVRGLLGTLDGMASDAPAPEAPTE